MQNGEKGCKCASQRVNSCFDEVSNVVRSIAKENPNIKPFSRGKLVRNKNFVGKELKVPRRFCREKGRLWRVSVKDGQNETAISEHWVKYNNAMNSVRVQENFGRTLVLSKKVQYKG